MSKAEILSKLLSVNGLFNNNIEIVASSITNISPVATTGNYNDLSVKMTTDTLEEGSTLTYASKTKQIALIHIIRG